MRKSISFWKISTSNVEIISLIKAWAAISIAFAVVMAGRPSISIGFLIGILIASITVGVGFLLHELAHKIAAQRYGCFAEFRSFDKMLLFAVAMSFFGIVFAAPGAVMISGHVTKRENGLISAAGPWTNIILALSFLSLNFVLPSLKVVWNYGYFVNTWLALFNMIPFWVLDGKKILAWNKQVWLITVLIGVVLFFAG